MKYLSTVLAGAALLAGAEAACTANLPIDEYTNYNTSGRNAVGGYSSDDESCSKLSGGSKSLSITPGQATCYYYTNFPSCYNAVAEGYTGITFTVTAPAGSKFNVVAKTLQGCSASATADSSFYNVALTGGSQTITIPFSSWTTGDFTNIQSFIFEDFAESASTFTLGAINFKCGGGTNPPSTSSVKTTLSTVTSNPPSSSPVKPSTSSPPPPPTTSSKPPPPVTTTSKQPPPPSTTSKPAPPSTTSKPAPPSTTPKPVTTSSDGGVIITRSGRPTPSEIQTRSSRGSAPIISIDLPILPPIVIGGWD